MKLTTLSTIHKKTLNSLINNTLVILPPIPKVNKSIIGYNKKSEISDTLITAMNNFFSSNPINPKQFKALN